MAVDLYGAGAYADQASKPVGGLLNPSRVYQTDRYVITGTPAYGYHFSPNDSAVIARPTTLSGLTSALSGASSGDIIWIPGTASFTASSKMTVPSGVIIASDRGLSGSRGGLINVTGSPVGVLSVGDNVTISGIRLIGNDAMRTSGGVGINASGKVGLEVENCEIAKFAYWCIALKSKSMAWDAAGRAHIHHSLIYGSQKHGYGYGIDVDGTSALIECNIFINNRHHISGQRTQSYESSLTNYEARYNLFWETLYFLNTGGTTTNVQVDQHGGNDSTSWGNPESPGLAQQAGGVLKVHHNTFYTNGQHENVGVRGIPKTSCEVYRNVTSKTFSGGGGAHSESNPSNGSFCQRLENLPISQSAFIRMSVTDNLYGGDDSPQGDLRSMNVSVEVSRR